MEESSRYYGGIAPSNMGFVEDLHWTLEVLRGNVEKDLFHRAHSQMEQRHPSSHGGPLCLALLAKELLGPAR